MGRRPFALDPGTTQELVDDLLAAGGSRPFRAFLAEPGEDAALLSLQVAAAAFGHTFGNTPELLRREYEPLMPAMTHVVLLDAEKRTAVGSVIIQRGPVEELKSVVDLAASPWSVSRTEALAAVGLAPGARDAVDLLLWSVGPDYRRLGLSPALLYGAWIAGAQHGVDRWTAIVDVPMLGMLRKLTGGGVYELAPPQPYLGSRASTPVMFRMDAARDGVILASLQAVGQFAEPFVGLCPRLEAAHRAFQALPVPGAAPVDVPVEAPERALTTERLARRRAPVS